MKFDELFQDGVKSFQAQDFEKASTFFTQALSIEPDNTTVLVNLGLSQFHLGQKLTAYSYFKKALYIDPYFTPALQGMDFVKSQVQIREIPHRIETYERMRDHFIQPFPVAIPLILSLLLAAIWGGKTIRYLSLKKKSYLAGEDPSPYGISNIIVSTLLALSLIWLGFFNYDASLHRGIIKLESVALRSAPLMTGPEILQIYGGLEVRILRQQDGWLQIEYPGAVAGWVAPGSVLQY